MISARAALADYQVPLDFGAPDLSCDCGRRAMPHAEMCRRCWFLETGMRGWRSESQVACFRALIDELRDGPSTTTELAERTEQSQESIIRSLATLVSTGRVRQRAGDGEAVYGLRVPREMDLG